MTLERTTNGKSVEVASQLLVPLFRHHCPEITAKPVIVPLKGNSIRLCLGPGEFEAKDRKLRENALEISHTGATGKFGGSL